MYVRRNVLNAGEIIAHFRAQGFISTVPAGDLHATIISSRIPIARSDSGEDGLTILPSTRRMMRRFGETGQAVVLLFVSSALSRRHKYMKRQGASWDYPDYQPHVTISYEFQGDLDDIVPWEGEIVLWPEVFEERW